MSEEQSSSRSALVPPSAAGLYRSESLMEVNESAPKDNTRLQESLKLPRWPFTVVAAVLLTSLFSGFLVEVPVRLPLSTVSVHSGRVVAVTEPGPDLDGLPAVVRSGTREFHGQITEIHLQTASGTSESLLFVTVRMAEQDLPHLDVDTTRVLVEVGTRPVLTDLVDSGGSTSP